MPLYYGESSWLKQTSTFFLPSLPPPLPLSLFYTCSTAGEAKIAIVKLNLRNAFWKVVIDDWGKTVTAITTTANNP